MGFWKWLKDEITNFQGIDWLFWKSLFALISGVVVLVLGACVIFAVSYSLFSLLGVPIIFLGVFMILYGFYLMENF